MVTQSLESEQSFPMYQALNIVELVHRWGVTREEVLRGTGIDEAVLEDPNARVSVPSMIALYEQARELTGEPGLGIYAGLRTRASAYGYLGIAWESAATFREVLDLLVRLIPAVTTVFNIRLQVEGNVASMIIEEPISMESARDMAIFNVVVGSKQISKALTGRDLGSVAELKMPEPAYYRRFAHLFPNIRFAQPVNRISFDAALLDLPLVKPDRVAFLLARDHCEKELRALGFDGALLERARRLLSKPKGFRSLQELATAFNMSPRTLERKLIAKGISYCKLLDEERCEKALLLLRSPENTLDEITERLGYSTVPNFVRAFRRWTGKTPAAYRRGKNAGKARSDSGD